MQLRGWLLFVGLVGYGYYQLTGDSGSGATLGSNKAPAYAVGQPRWGRSHIDIIRTPSMTTRLRIGEWPTCWRLRFSPADGAGDRSLQLGGQAYSEIIF